MEDVLQFIQSQAEFAPYFIFGLLLLAGLNLPVSEDAMLFVSGLMASQNPEMVSEFFVAVFLGAYFSDVIAYWLGRLLGNKLFDIGWFAKMVSPEKLNKVTGFYEKYGMITLFVGRFIPFGVRNALFISAGFSKMNFTKFAIADFLACVLSSSVFFYLYYKSGKVVAGHIQTFGIVMFSLALVGILTILVYKKFIKKQG